MRRERKYQYYEIKVINNIDLSEENITIMDKEKIDKSNWKQMLEKYREIKEEYKGQYVTIKFLGVSNNSTVKIIHEKVYSQKIDTLSDLINHLDVLINQFKNRNKHLSEMQGVYDSKQQSLLHYIGAMHGKDIYEMTDKDKIDRLIVFNELQANYFDRRENKNEINLLKSIKDKGLLVSLINVNRALNETKEKIYLSNIKKFKESKKEPLNNKNKFIKEIPYKNFKDRIKIMKELEQKYEKITYDENKKICIGRNTVY